MKGTAVLKEPGHHEHRTQTGNPTEDTVSLTQESVHGARAYLLMMSGLLSLRGIDCWLKIQTCASAMYTASTRPR